MPQVLSSRFCMRVMGSTRPSHVGCTLASSWASAASTSSSARPMPASTCMGWIWSYSGKLVTWARAAQRRS